MDHFDILGRSIADPVVISYLAEHERYDPADFRKNSELGFFGGFDSGFGLQVESLSAFNAHFEAPRSRGLPDDREGIVTRLSFTGLDEIRPVQRAYAAALPFGLVFGDTSDAVADKLKTAPFRKDGSSSLPDYSAERFVHTHIVGGAVVIAKYDANLRLMAIYLMQADRSTLNARRRRASPPKQKILPGNIGKVEALRAQIPTPRWREAIAEGDELFDPAEIARADAALNAFVDGVKAATANADAEAIYAAVKDIVVAINEINDRTGMIETLERDELGVFIDMVVKATGFDIPDGEDITGEWREW